MHTKGIVPVSFTEHFVSEQLMSPKRSAPITVLLNHFTGWKCDFMISYTDHVYSLEQIVNIVNLAGFGIGIGSGRTSDYGRYHVTDLQG